nr:hypothetical protein B0A51_00738 [Rachicladosporium sp. CCFEE 5018]
MEDYLLAFVKDPWNGAQAKGWPLFNTSAPNGGTMLRFGANGKAVQSVDANDVQAPSARQQELERLYNARRGHVPQISISDDDHHVTEAIGSYYGSPAEDHMPRNDPRPLSFISGPSEAYDVPNNRRHGNYFDSKRTSPPRRTGSNDRAHPASPSEGSISPKMLHRMSSRESENALTQSPPPLTRQTSSETAVQQFPLNDIDYESSPAAVALEMSNLQAIRRMSMNVDMADPDLPSFMSSFGGVPTQPPSHDDDEDDPGKLFWVPANVHPELAPKEFKAFVEERVDKIRRRSGGEDGLSPVSLERSGSGSGSLRRKKSMLSHSINTRGDYQDGAERLERKRSRGAHFEGQTAVSNLSELEELVNDPAQLIRRLSIDNARLSQDSGVEVPASQDMPVLPPGGPTLKRSTRTTYRRGSLRKGERVPFSKRAISRQGENENDDSRAESPVQSHLDEPILGLTRVQTEPTPVPSMPRESGTAGSRPSSSRRKQSLTSSQADELTALPERKTSPPPARYPPVQRQRVERPKSDPEPEIPLTSQPVPRPSLDEEPQRAPGPQPRQFQSRIAAGGRTTAQLPGYTNSNPLPHIIETLPDGTKKAIGHQQVLQFPERKSSHEIPRNLQRGGAHMRPVPGREGRERSSTLDDISSNPSPLPGSGSTRTDALTMVPTYEDKKVDKKDGTRKSSWKWLIGHEDEEKERKSKEERRVSDDNASIKSGKSSKLTKPNDKARLDVLQNSIDGHTPVRGRESIVLNREDLKLDDERKKESKKATKPRKDSEDKEPGLLSAIFGGGKKKTSETDLKEKKRKAERILSVEPPPRILKPDIDYNWTRFSILEERAIYRMAHIKLANPRRALYSQVLLSNFMYSYLAKVQMMHPQMQIPASPAQKAAQQRKRAEQEAGQPVEFREYQRYAEQQSKSDASQHSNASDAQPDTTSGAPTSDQQLSQESHAEWPDFRSSATSTKSSSSPPNFSRSNGSHNSNHSSNGYGGAAGSAAGGAMAGGAVASNGYAVASTHDYMGYSSEQMSFGDQAGMWDDDEKGEEMW